ncbi:AAA family ATPase [Novosphingobium rosa]|uniref:AAA family ATPase n=1 Tax=Novosphingobium rosa TaxID=76978 RepID=UPI00082FD128|nr:AAA family ATPase [Novosphingobium rosa]
MPLSLAETIDADQAYGHDAAPRRPIYATPYQWRDPETLPRRPWIYGRQLLRGSVFLIVAPGATGKSALVTGMAMALCSGRPLLGAEVWDGPKKVWLWNLEDSLNDLAFSIQAAALHWDLTPADLDGRLYVDSGLDGAGLKLARQDRDGARIAEEASAAIIAEIQSRQIDVLVIDPFISSHGLSENDNAAIDSVAKEWSRIASVTGCAVILIHHARKTGGEVVTAESSRGASSLVDAARGGLALNTMTEAEADKYGIERDRRRRYFRADDAKPNRAPAGSGQWFELVSVHLENGPDGGDSVGVATAWSTPDPFDDVTTDHLRLAQGLIADGNWRESIQSPEWAGKVVADVLNLDLDDKAQKAKAANILRTWIKSGSLVVSRETDGKGNPRPFIRVGSTA